YGSFDADKVFGAGRPLLFYCLLYLLVDVRHEALEAEIFKLLLHPRYPEPAGQWRVDVEGFLGNFAAALGLLELEGLHVVQFVGELYEDYADVLDHCKHYFADCFGFSLIFIIRLNYVYFGDAKYEGFDLPTELLAKFSPVEHCVFEDIVKKHRNYYNNV